VAGSPTASATVVMVTGSLRSRRVATSGSSRCSRTSFSTVATSAGGQADPGGDLGGDRGADEAVVAGQALADVVQEGADQQQVGRSTSRV
jgi:hypothetical protein